MHNLFKKYKANWIVVSVICITLLITVVAATLYIFRRIDSDLDSQKNSNETTTEISVKSDLQTHIMLSGLNKPWDVVFAGGQMLVSENDGIISAAAEGVRTPILNVPNIEPKGEGGLMGMAVDTQFDENRFVYACYNTAKDIRVSRWALSEGGTELNDQKDIVTGIVTNNGAYPGRHSGCRIEFGPDGYLWIGTGDAAIGATPQDPTSLGGKILRVDREGKPAKDNLGGNFDKRIYSYGHRNTQGIAFTKGADYLGVSTEHGPNVNDEVNLLKSGNFGWNPVPGYNESVPMTDIDSYSEAVKEIWASGGSTIAPSGATYVYGEQWGEYNGALFVAMLKGQQIRILTIDKTGALKSEKTIFSKQFGRIRTVRQGPDEALYITTDNGNDQDVIVRVTPR